MKNQFIREAQSDPEVLDMLRLLHEAAHLERTHVARQAVITDLSLLWAAIADAIFSAPDQQTQADINLLDIARRGSDSCVIASQQGGVEVLQECAVHLTSFVRAPGN